MATKQNSNGAYAPDGGTYVVLTDGVGNLAPAGGSGATVGIDQTTPGITNSVTTDGVVDATQRVDSVTATGVGAQFSTAGFGSVSFQIISNSSANTFQIQGSNDGGTTWTILPMRANGPLAAAVSVLTSALTTNTVYTPNTVMPLMRWNCTAFVSGTLTIATGFKRLYTANSLDVTLQNATIAVTSTNTSVGAVASTGGIATTARLASSAATTNATTAKGSTGRIYGIQLTNSSVTACYLVLYDVATLPVPGTTAIRKKVTIPASSSVILEWAVGLQFANGIGYAFTNLPADSDTTAIAAAQIVQMNIDYI